jgi:hypothetical protein
VTMCETNEALNAGAYLPLFSPCAAGSLTWLSISKTLADSQNAPLFSANEALKTPVFPELLRYGDPDFCVDTVAVIGSSPAGPII